MDPLAPLTALGERTRLSPAQIYGKLSPALRAELKLTEKAMAGLRQTWAWWARPQQLPPKGDWFIWVIKSGRGFGKTRAGAQWVIQLAKDHPGCRIALVASTPEDYRDLMIEGVSGILPCSPEDFPAHYQPSQRRILWENGSAAYCFSDKAPESLRGPNNDFAWIDEFAKFRYQEKIWDNLMFTMRGGTDPKVLITTTPRPTKKFKDLLKMKRTVVISGSLYENKDNLADPFIEMIHSSYEGTRTGRQEIHGELLEDNPGALWSRERIEDQRVLQPPEMERVVIGVDPATTANETSAETGIVACGRGIDLLGYCLGDYSMKGSPNQWARAVVTAYYQHKANLVIAEANQGGDMVKAAIQTIDDMVPVRLVTAKKNKQARADPVSALHEQGRIYHVGTFAQLEDQLCEWVPDPGVESPDRLDAYVYGFTDLFVLGGKLEWVHGEEDEDTSVEQVIKEEGVFWPR